MAERTEAPEPLTVNRHTQLDRYEARLGSELISVIEFTLRGDTVIVTHTGTEPAHRGHGYAGQATKAMLDDIRANGQSVRPLCPFTARFMAAHPAYDDLRA